jgi:lincosamide nucleotidyltransferase A/C/D/E
MTSNRAVEILDRLSAYGVQVWVHGGWGIDALLERQTRQHDDLDLIAPIEDVPRLRSALRGLGYEVARDGLPSSFEMTDAEGHQVDVHPVSVSDTGEAIYQKEDGGEWVCPELSGVGLVAGRRVPCLSAAGALLSHATGYALDAAHRADVAALSEKFGLPVPRYTSGP